MDIQRLCTDDWLRLKQLRLTALRDEPLAFGVSLVEAQRYSAADWHRQLDTSATFVAVNDGSDIGLVCGTPDSADADVALLVSMWVSPDTRGLGAGANLINELVSWAREAGFVRIALDVANDNRPAIALYEKMGFLPTGETGSLPPPRTHILEHRRALNL